MKLLFDHNLSLKLPYILKPAYPESQHVREIGMERSPDVDIWNYAKINNLTIVSKDSDFYYQSMLQGQPPKVIWIRLGNCKTDQIFKLLNRAG